MKEQLFQMFKYCSYNELIEIELELRKAKKKFPKKERTVESKPVDPVVQFRLGCHRLCKAWLDQNGHEMHAWDGLQRKGLNGIIDKIKFSLSKTEGLLTEERVAQSFEGMMRKLPDFWRNKIDFDLFDRRFSAIVSQIRDDENARKQLNGKTGNTADIANEALQLLNARIQNRK